MSVRILANRHDFDEFVFVDGPDCWADGERHESILKCHSLDGLDYGVPAEEVFEEISRRDFDGVLRALLAVEDDTAGARPVIDEVDRFCAAFTHWLWKAKERGEAPELRLEFVDSEDARQVQLSRHIGSFIELIQTCYGHPSLFQTPYYLNERLAALENPPIELPALAEPVATTAVRFFQEKSNPFEIIPLFRGNYYSGASVLDAIHKPSFEEIGFAGMRTLRYLGQWLRSDGGGEGGRHVRALREVAREVEQAREFRFSAEEIDEAFDRLLDAVQAERDQLEDFIEMTRQVRTASQRLDRALLRIAKQMGDGRIRELPAFSGLIREHITGP